MGTQEEEEAEEDEDEWGERGRRWGVVGHRAKRRRYIGDLARNREAVWQTQHEQQNMNNAT